MFDFHYILSHMMFPLYPRKFHDFFPMASPNKGAPPHLLAAQRGRFHRPAEDLGDAQRGGQLLAPGDGTWGPKMGGILVLLRAGLRVVPEWSYEHQWEAHLAGLLAGKKDGNMVQEW